MQPKLTDRLRGGDSRSLGDVAQVVRRVLRKPALLDELIHAMHDADEIVRMRASDAVEKVSAKHPEYLQPYASLILRCLSKIEQPTVKWHIAQMIPRLSLRASDRVRAQKILFEYLRDEAIFVRTHAMSALSTLAAGDSGLRKSLIPRLRTLRRTGSAAVKNRAGKLLEMLAKSTPK